MGKRSEHRETTERAILDAGLSLLASGGQEALTIRGLARRLSLAPSALYRYVANRDELLTLLIAHSHNDLADAVELAHAAVEPSDLRGRWRAVAHAIRDWSREHRFEFELIFGTPVRGYAAPPERTTEPGTRVLFLLARIGPDVERAGFAVPRPPGLVAAATESLPGVLAAAAGAGLTMAPETAMDGLAAWHLVMGAVSSELFGYLGRGTVDSDRFFDAIVLIGEQLLFGPAASTDGPG